jgi:hypothetical protein
MKIRWELVVALSLWAASAAAAETGYVIRVTDLKARPYLDAETTVKLPEKTRVEILVRQGPWMQVQAQGKTGYVRMLQVRMNLTESAQARVAASPASSRTVAAVNRPVGSRPTVTTGVRGFDEQGLKDAQPDPAAFERMASFAASRDQAQQFAQRTPLAARSVAYYDEDGKPIEESK